MEEILLFWNPWWKGEYLLESINRSEYFNKINLFIQRKEVLCFSGVRRSGKSTLMLQTIQSLLETVNNRNILYINFDDERFVGILDEKLLDKILNEYCSMLNPEGKLFVFLDEIQSVPFWEKWVKRMYDSQKNIKFVISGSSSALVSSEFSTLLTGRNLLIEVFPFSFKEFLEYKCVSVGSYSSVKSAYLDLYDKRTNISYYLDEYLKSGGFPEVVKDSSVELRLELLQRYFRDILYKDLVKRYKIKKSSLLEQLALYLLTNFTNKFSINKLAKYFGCGFDTVKEFLGYLDSAYLLFTIEFFSFSKKESLQKPLKSYCIDGGMRNNLVLKFSRDSGRLAENLVFLYLKRVFRTVYYWDSNNEVDFVVYDKKLKLFNVSYGDLNERESKGLVELAKKRKSDCFLITNDLYDSKKIDGINIKLVPLWLFLCLDASALK